MHTHGQTEINDATIQRHTANESTNIDRRCVSIIYGFFFAHTAQTYSNYTINANMQQWASSCLPVLHIITILRLIMSFVRVRVLQCNFVGRRCTQRNERCDPMRRINDASVSMSVTIALCIVPRTQNTSTNKNLTEMFILFIMRSIFFFCF